MGDPSEPTKTNTATTAPISVSVPSIDIQPQDNNATIEGEHIGDKYEVPAYEPHSSFDSLKHRIRHHYELASDYYYSLWGQHIHHGYFETGNETKEAAQVKLINLLLDMSQLAPHSTVLDVGCGIGGTTRHLARDHGCKVTGITISGRQVEIAKRLTDEETSHSPPLPLPLPPSLTATDATAATTTGTVPTIPIGSKGGSVTYLELDAELLSTHFSPGAFNCVWISEALSHLPNKALFFANAARLLAPGGKLVIADWFKAAPAVLTPRQISETIKPIEDGMLLPPLCCMDDYVSLAGGHGLTPFAQPRDISAQVAKTWDISWTLVSSPSLWAFAISQGRDGLAFLQAFRAMRRGYAEGSFRYGVLVFQKGEGEEKGKTEG